MNISTGILTALLSTVLAQAGSDSAEDCRKARDQLMRAIYAVDFAGMTKAREKLATLFDDRKVGADALYHASHASWWLSRNDQAGPKKGGELLQSAIDSLTRSVETRPEDADSWALLGWICLQRIGTDPTLARDLGPLQDDAFAKALELAPKNPRVVLLHAMSLFNLPEEHGGDRETSWARFAEATRLPIPEPDPQATGPIWGAAEVWGEMGIYLMSAGKIEEAVAAFEKALKVEPGWRMVRDRALPRAKRLLGRRRPDRDKTEQDGERQTADRLHRSSGVLER